MDLHQNRGKDSWCNDGVDYTLLLSIDSNDRDTDEDGYIDTEDSCDNTPGTSVTTGKAVLIQILMAIQTQNKAGVQIMVQMLSLTNNLSGKIQIMMALAII